MACPLGYALTDADMLPFQAPGKQTRHYELGLNSQTPTTSTDIYQTLASDSRRPDSLDLFRVITSPLCYPSSYPSQLSPSP